jgi:hypothetical protein
MAGTGIERPRCARCYSLEHVKMRRQITASGVSQIAWYCEKCKRWAELPVRWQPHDLLIPALAKQGATIDNLPVVNDRSHTAPCVICGEPGEWMHWAPQALAEQFGPEWGKWPQDPLCVKHHRQWHDTVWPGHNGTKG